MGKLGYSTYTLTDLTETLPISLVLETNKEQNIQIKEGKFYTPNFETGIEGEELIITPSLFLGSIEKEVPTDYPNGSYIYYETGEMEDDSIHEKQYYYYEDNESEEVYVDVEGRLHYKKNLKENLTIEAYIKGFKNKVDQDYVTSELVRAQNPITILLLEQGKGIYTLVISSSGNREHFEENNKKDIILTATLYKGAEPLSDEVEYEWDIVTDNDTEDNTNDDYGNGVQKDENKTDFISHEKEITIQRADVNNIQVYQCTATFNGLEFSSQKIIRDFTDSYTNQLIADSSLILTPNKTTVTLTNQVWYQAQIINEKDADSNRFNYKWVLLKSDNKTEIVLKEGKDKELIINLNAEKEVENEETGEIEIIKIYPKENFSILGMVTIDGKTVTVNYADIKYQPVAYSVNVSPKTIFVPVTKDGNYRGTESTFTQTIKFQLLDENKSPLLYNSLDSTMPDLQKKDGDKDLSDFDDEQINQKEGLWSFEIPFKLDTIKNNNNLWETDINSKTYEFTYGYLGNTFTEEIEVVKNYAGADGKQGFSGYTIDLSNEFHAFAGGEMRADSKQSTSCQISSYYGDKTLFIQKIEIGNSSKTIIYPRDKINSDLFSDDDYVKYSFGSNNYLFFQAEESDSGSVLISIRTNNDSQKESGLFLTEIQPIPIYISFSENENDEEKKWKTFLKTFTYTINYNGKSYYLNLSSNSIKYTEINQTYDPNNINVNALCRETSGQATPYTNGKIIYSLDNKKTWKISTGSISGYKNLENIYIRLYSAAASDFPSADTIINEELTEFDKYLLDTETIPILTSMEGYEFGGENLIRWSKELPIKNNKWVSSSNLLSIGRDGDFSTLDFIINESTEKWMNFKTPKITLEEEYIGKTFCFSCYVYSDDWSSIKEDYASIAVIGTTTFEPILNEDGGWTREGYRSILRIDKNGPVKNYEFSYEPEWKTGDWIKIYKIFTLDETFFNDSDLTSNIPTLNDFKYLHLNFYLGSTGSFRIKKPKLEMGNIPTNWSASPYDVDYTSMSANLIPLQSTYYVTLKNTDPYIILGEELLGGATYCLSWNSCEYNNNSLKILTYAFFTENGYQNFGTLDLSSQNYHIISIPEDLENVTVRLYGGQLSETEIGNIDNLTTINQGQTYTFKQLKFALGETPTDYAISSAELIEQILAMETEINNTYNSIPTDKRIVEIIGTDGKKFFATTEQLNGLTSTVTEVKNGLSQTTTAATINKGNIELISKHFKVVTEGNDAPYIELIVNTANSDSQVIQMRLTNDQLLFYTTEDVDSNKEITPLAYFNANKLYIERAEIMTNLRLGKSITDNGVGFLNMQYDTDGVFFTWENN